MKRKTEYHCKVAVMKNKNDLENAKKLAAYEDLGLDPEELQNYVCDELCRWPYELQQTELNEKCRKCRLGGQNGN